MYSRVLKLPRMGLVGFAAACGGQEAGPHAYGGAPDPNGKHER